MEPKNFLRISLLLLIALLAFSLFSSAYCLSTPCIGLFPLSSYFVLFAILYTVFGLMTEISIILFVFKEKAAFALAVFTAELQMVITALSFEMMLLDYGLPASKIFAPEIAINFLPVLIALLLVFSALKSKPELGKKK